MSLDLCSVPDCNRPHRARSFCSKHYQRAALSGRLDTAPRRHYFNDPEAAFAARTEWRGDCLIWTGAKSSYGYGMFNSNNQRYVAHRYAWERARGPIPDGMLVDHAQHCDPACVNVDHLRLATRSQNNANKRGARQDNKSTGVRNVYPTRNRKRFRVSVGHNGERHWGGVFDTLEEAATAAESLREELFGTFAGKG